MLKIGTKVTSRWGSQIEGTIVGYGFIFMAGRPGGAGADGVIGNEEGYMQHVYLVDLGRSRMFDLNREPRGAVAARILTLQADRVTEVK